MAFKSELIANHYVMGMSWQKTILHLEDQSQQARIAARALKANLYCVVSSVVEDAESVLGAAKLKALASKGQSLYSLALGYAQICSSSGHGFAAIRLDDSRFWICGITQGVPASGFDQIVTHAQDVGKQYEAFVANLNTGVSLVLHSNDASLIDLLPASSHLPISALIDAASQRPPLHKIPSTLPKPVLYALVLAVLGYGAKMGWEHWRDYQEQQENLLAQSQAYVDPTVAWTRAINHYAATQPMVASDELKALRASVNKLPTSIAGWRLAQIDCLSSKQAWTCTLSYERSLGIGLDPTNAEFAQLHPKEWTDIQYPTLNLARAVLSIDAQPESLDLDQLDTLVDAQLTGLSRFQQVMRAFSRVEIGAFAEQAIEAPLDNAGQPIARPADLQAVVYKAPVEITGPLRSMDLLIDLSMKVSWSTLKVLISPIERDWHSSGQAGLTQSLLQASLRGDLYAKR